MRIIYYPAVLSALFFASPVPAADPLAFTPDRVASLAGAKALPVAAVPIPESKPVAKPRREVAGGKFALIVVAEDDFFEGDPLTLDDAYAVLAGGMPEAACIRASRLINNSGGMTACVDR